MRRFVWLPLLLASACDGAFFTGDVSRSPDAVRDCGAECPAADAQVGEGGAGDGGAVGADAASPFPDGGADCEPTCDQGRVCDSARSECVDCVSGQEAACRNLGLVCLASGTECVQCNDDADCLSGACRDDRTCAPCADDDDCGQGSCLERQCVECLEDNQCDAGVCRDGVCVECAPGRDDACSGATAYCDGARSTCVECLDSSHCDAGTPVCRQGACVACSTDAECATRPERPACVSGACEVCSDTNVSRCEGTALPYCNAQQMCARCVDDLACGPTAAQCAGNRCVGCDASGQCARFAEATVCNPGSGLCVECLADLDTTACQGQTPVCAPDNRCVECAAASDCREAAPVCGDGFSCEGCSERAECEVLYPATPACDWSRGACVVCVPGVDEAACDQLGLVCLAAGEVCVECNTRSDCAEAQPSCNGSNECDVCVDDQDCTRFGKVCDGATGACVECRPDAADPEAENCPNGNACDPESLRCTGQPRRSLGDCGDSALDGVGVVRCVSDSECADGLRCVRTEFNGTDYGSYCLQQTGAQVCPSPVAARREATSSLGITDFYCFPDDSFTTCEGLLSFQQVCSDPAECGAPGQDDALCESSRCTYGCNSDADCPGVDCIGSFGSQYCDPN